jgi:G:T-mismatch repair DNA endonuclease (very short patch repair protein)
VKKIHGLSRSQYIGRLSPEPAKSLIASNKEKAEKRKEDFQKALEKVLEKFPSSRILELYETGHTPAIIALHFVKPEVGDIHKRLADIVKAIMPYEKSHHKKHLSMPVWWRRKWSWGVNDDEAKALNQNVTKSQLSVVRESRKASKYGYHKKNSPLYWMDLGYAIEQATDLASSSKSSRSPRTIPFWMRKGLSESEAKMKVSEVCAAGGRAACQLLDGKFTSKLEDRVARLLDELGVHYTRQYRISGAPYLYDFLVEDRIVEVNGTYWHADPRLYSGEEMHPTLNIPTKEIWEFDKRKQGHASKNGFTVVVIWETEVVNLTANSLQSLLR